MDIEDFDNSFTAGLPSPSSYLLRPLSPSLSISHLDVSSFEAEGLMDLNEFLFEMNTERKASIQEEEVKPKNRVQRGECDIKKIYEGCSNLKYRKVTEHEKWRNEFMNSLNTVRGKIEKPVEKSRDEKKSRGDEFDRKQKSQMMSLLSILEDVKSLQQRVLRLS